jgi:hypothetical protein
MTIPKSGDKSKTARSRIPRDVLIIAILVLASTLSFGLGYMAGLDASQAQGAWPQTSQAFATSSPGAVVASKSGMKYYLPSCAGVERISDDNKVWFPSASAAQAAGYTPAADCDGL